MGTQIFVNLPVTDLKRSVDFFSRLGFKFDERFSDEKAACMIVGDDAYVMLLVEEFFKTFTRKALSDTTSQSEVIVSLSAESRVAVDEKADRALASGARPSNDTIEMNGMYCRSFEDPDGHLWEVLYMDQAAVQ